MSNTLKKQKERMDAVRYILDLFLRDSTPRKMREMFPNLRKGWGATTWQYKVLMNLIDANIILTDNKLNFKSYWLNPDSIEHVRDNLSNDEWLAGLVWTQKGEIPQPLDIEVDEQIDTVQAPAVTVDNVEPETEVKSVIQDSGEIPSVEVMTTILRLVAGCVEQLAALHNKVNDLSSKIDRLSKVWE